MAVLVQSTMLSEKGAFSSSLNYAAPVPKASYAAYQSEDAASKVYLHTVF